MEANLYVPPTQPILTIQFDSVAEAKELYDELRMWNTGSKSAVMQQFFKALEGIFTK
jgi:hypothetical protein